MGLRGKTLLIVGLGLVALVAILAAASRSAILDGFARVEEESVRDAIGRVRDALAVDSQALASTNTDYAQWDDTYAFVPANDDAFVAANLNDDTFNRMRLDACIVARADGTVIRRLAPDGRSVPDALVATLSRDRELARRVRREGGGVVGLVAAKEAGLWLVAAHAIVRSDSSGPSRGTLYMGRALDREEIARLSETTHQSLRVTVLPAERRASAALGSGATVLVRGLSDTRIAGWASLRDVHGRPVAVLRTVTPRPVLAHGRTVWRMVLVALVLVALFAGGATLVMLERTVVQRLEEIVSSAKHVAESGDLSTRVPVRSDDELGMVARTLNGMLADLEHDASERQRLETALRQTQKMEALGRLAGGVAHDFNNLVMIIGSHAELVLEAASDPDTKDSAEEIGKACGRAASLTRQLLAFSKKQVLQPEILDLGRVLSDVERMLKRLIGEDIALFTDVAADLWRIKADAGQLEQVLMNLAVNARDAMPRGGRIYLTAANETLGEPLGDVPAGDWLKLTVRDTGVGMDEATQARVFEPFFTTKALGTGLGLATVFGIVQQSRGHIRLSSAPGQGTTFEIRFPRVQAPHVAAGAPRRAASRGHEVILVVEDESSLRRVVCDSLRRAGYDVLEARDGVQAKHLWSERGSDVDLVLSDVVMPQVGGPALKRWIDEQRPRTPTIFMSGYTNSETFDELLEDTGAEFIQKPFTPAELSRRVREVLDRPQRTQNACAAPAPG